MKKRIIITFVGVLALFSNPLCASEQYSISLDMGYGHNLTYGSFANFDLGAYMPLNNPNFSYFEYVLRSRGCII